MRSCLSLRRAVMLPALLAFATSASAQSVTLRYRWTKGESLTYRMVMQTSSSVTGMPGINEMKIDQTMTQVIKMTTVDVAEDGTATLRETFESLKMEMAGPMSRSPCSRALKMNATLVLNRPSGPRSTPQVRLL